MRSQVKLGKVFGIPIGLHYSWLLIAFLIVFSLSNEFSAANPEWGSGVIWGVAILTAVLFFASLLVHELAHSVVATSNGISVKEITLFALGGVSQIKDQPATAKIEFWMAIAGPLASVLIGLGCLATRVLIGGPVRTPATEMLSWLGYINLGLALFNLVPGYPLDGGRVLRAVVWWKTGNPDRSTQIAARVGQFVGILFVILGILRFFGGSGIGGLWIAFIGWFLLQAARESYVQVGLLQALKGIRVGDVMTHDCPTVDGWLNLQNFVEEHLLSTGKRCFIVLEQGRVAGLLTPHEIKAVDRAKWPYKTVADVMRSIEDIRSVNADAPLASALEAMGQYDLNQVPVVTNGHLDGVLSRDQVLRYLQTRAELRV